MYVLLLLASPKALHNYRVFICIKKIIRSTAKFSFTFIDTTQVEGYFVEFPKLNENSCIAFNNLYIQRKFFPHIFQPDIYTAGDNESNIDICIVSSRVKVYVYMKLLFIL